MNRMHTTYAAIVAVQRAEGVAALVGGDELDVTAAKDAGVDIASLLVSCPDTLAIAAEIVETLLRSGCVDLIVVASGLPDAELGRLNGVARAMQGVLVLL